MVHACDALHRSIWRNSKFNRSTWVTNLYFLQQVANRSWQLIWQVG